MSDASTRPLPARARVTVVGQDEDGTVVVVLDDGTRTRLAPTSVASLRRVHPGQRLVIGDDGMASIGGTPTGGGHVGSAH